MLAIFIPTLNPEEPNNSKTSSNRAKVKPLNSKMTGSTPGHLRKGESHSVLRNPAIVEVFKDLGFIEKLGSGIPRVLRLLEEHGLAEPEFSESEAEFTVTLHGPGEKFMELAQESIPEWMEELNERQIRAIRYTQEKGRITNREYRELCGIGWDTAHRDLSELMQRGILNTSFSLI